MRLFNWAPRLPFGLLELAQLLFEKIGWGKGHSIIGPPQRIADAHEPLRLGLMDETFHTLASRLPP
jgi:hypothetical protein